MKLKNLKREWKNITFNTIFAILTFGAVILTYKNTLLTTFLVGLIAIFGLIKWKSKITLVLFLFAGMFGALLEMYAINQGVWAYSIPDFKNIPFWLFLVWGSAGVFIYQTALEIKKFGIKK